MSKYLMSIKLLSDLCVSDGGVYNSAIDTDICYDSKGLPYIPAKRLKGCLRECAIELADWGMEIDERALFGTGGEKENSGKIRIANAVLTNYDEISKEISAGANHIFYHPQNVLRQFSYIRTQTAINYDTGAADETSLRTMRVVSKGLLFESIVELPDELKKQFETCCMLLRHMGIARTRGLGEVEVKLGKKINDDQTKEKNKVDVPYTEDADYLEYIISLEEPVICKSVAGGEIKSQEYIDGSKILGLVSECLRRQGDSYSELIKEGNILCTNAYIADNGKRSQSIPASCFKIKNNSTEFIDKLGEGLNDAYSETEQLNQMKPGYMIEVDDSMKVIDVACEERYHHRRPEDKGIGRASEDGTNDSMFYTISSISEDQSFIGRIHGTRNQIKKIYELLKEKDIVHIGYGKSGEYGSAKIKITGLSAKEVTDIKTRHFAIKLEAPAICYGKNAYASADYRNLIEEVKYALGRMDIREEQHFLNYTEVGGYNVTWKMRKPTLSAFDIGSVFEFTVPEMAEPITIESDTLFIGERNSEGYGEISFIDLEKPRRARRTYYKKVDDKKNVSLTIRENSLGNRIYDQLVESYIATDVMEHVSADEKKRATVSNLLLMCSESKSYEDVYQAALRRYEKVLEEKKDKLEYAKEIFYKVEQNSGRVLQQFEEQYHISREGSNEKDIRFKYLKAYLKEMKYRIREAKR